jgi:S-adenosylmethionine hydrolase
MSIITLTTDFGHKDYFVSVTKAALIQEAPEADDSRYFSRDKSF